LKAVGMKGRQVVFVFTIESLFLGIAGTVVGILLGIAASLIVNNITQGLAGYTIPWSLHADTLVAAVLVGIMATVLFAYIPVLRASRARPVAALRSDIETSTRRPWFRPFVRSMRRAPLGTVGTGLRRTPRGFLRNSCTWSSDSSARICWLSGGCWMPSRWAARVTWPSSATATK